jgi:predicted GH43/DUF377 family glycosyl hydrolase
MVMTTCRVVKTGRVTVTRPNRLAKMYVLSPYVWCDGGEYRLLLRTVPRRDDEPRLKISEIWHGRSADGRAFVMDPFPSIFPSPDAPDRDGCEDPTVLHAGGELRVWYTGYEAAENTGRLLGVRGPEVDQLAATGMALDSRAPFINPKEAALAPVGDSWRMFFEFAQDGLSAIGMASSSTLDGPWCSVGDAPLASRSDRWDGAHMSPGPIIRTGSDYPLMFYNGANEDGAWRIGWTVFDRNLTRIVQRCEQPLVVPTDLPGPDARDMAFVASAIEQPGGATLFYTVADQELRFAEVVIEHG